MQIEEKNSPNLEKAGESPINKLHNIVTHNISYMDKDDKGISDTARKNEEVMRETPTSEAPASKGQKKGKKAARLQTQQPPGVTTRRAATKSISQ